MTVVSEKQITRLLFVFLVPNFIRAFAISLHLRAVVPSVVRWQSSHASDGDSTIGTPPLSTLVSRRAQQNRRKTIKKKPRNYWSDIENVRRELRQFWVDRGVEPPQQQTVAAGRDDVVVPPPIPSEALLRHYGRNDLKWAVVSHGGREILSELLGGATIVPGRWKRAVRESAEVQQLLLLDASLSSDVPPPSPQQQRKLQLARASRGETANEPVGNSSALPRRWSHHSGRKPKGYWSRETVIRELHQYVLDYRSKHKRPAVWMPRSSELGASGRDDIRQAFARFGGAAGICRSAGLVTFREWRYFEGQLELLVDLKGYLDEYHDSDYGSFPPATEIRQNGYRQLYSLIQYYGGRKFLAARLSMCSTARRPAAASTTGKRGRCNDDDHVGDLNWGPFDLEFAVRLLAYVRQDHLRQEPPLKHPVLAIPAKVKLLSNGSREGVWLAKKIEQFGGTENVARRLGLALPSHDVILTSPRHFPPMTSLL